MILLLLQLTIVGWLILGPVTFMKDVLDLAHLDFYFRYIILFSALANGAITILFEQLIVRILGNYEMQEEINFKKTPKSQDISDDFTSEALENDEKHLKHE